MRVLLPCRVSQDHPRNPARRGTVPAAILLLPALCLAIPSFGAERTVRQSGGADYTTVQAAIDAAQPGDTVTILDSATYVEDVSFGQLHPSLLNSKANVTLQAAAGMRPTIQAANTADRFGQNTADFNGMLILSQGVTVKGLNILNGADASGALLGLATSLSIQAGQVSVMDCDLSQAGGVVAPKTSVVALVSDLARLGGGPATVDNVLFQDCTVHDGTRIGVAAFPLAFELNPGVVGSIHHVTLERCTIHQCAGPGIEGDGHGSLTLTDVTVRNGGGNGFELATQQTTLTDCEARDNAGIGISMNIADQVPPGSPPLPTLHARGLTCLGNGSEGLALTEGTAMITNLVCATNGSYNLHFAPAGDLTLEVDHATLYYQPGNAFAPPNLYIDAGAPVSGPRLEVKNSIFAGPIGLGGYQDLVLSDVIVDTTMFWNGESVVTHEIAFTDSNPVTPVDPEFNQPSAGDYRLMETSPVATADTQGGPLGGAGIMMALPASISIDSLGLSSGQVFLEWEGHPGLMFEIQAGGVLNTGTWSVLDSVPGASGTQHWDDTRTPTHQQYYRVEGRHP